MSSGRGPADEDPAPDTVVPREDGDEFGEPGKSAPPVADEPAEEPVAAAEPPTAQPSPNMLPGRERRRSRLERLLVRLIATFGVIAIGVAIGAILTSSNVRGWIIGLVVAGVSVILSALLWSSRQL